MSKRLNLLLVTVLSGVLITAATYLFTQDGQRLTCGSGPHYTPGALNRDLNHYQAERGFPYWFYKDAVGSNCDIPDTQDANMSSQFRAQYAVLDFLIWTLLSSLFVIELSRIRSEHE